MVEIECSLDHLARSSPLQLSENGGSFGESKHVETIDLRRVVAEINGVAIHPAGDKGPYSPKEITAELLGY